MLLKIWGELHKLDLSHNKTIFIDSCNIYKNTLSKKSGSLMFF